MPILRAKPKTEEELQEEAKRELGRKAFDDGRYEEALGLFRASLTDMAIRWFREEGFRFQRPPGDFTPKELLIGLAMACQREVEALGDDASHKLQSANWLLNTMARFQEAAETEFELTPEGLSRKMSEMAGYGAMMGQLDMIMNLINLGWLDKLALFEVEREKRRLGAQKVNARKASAKEKVLAEAIGIAARNGTLSNEDLARIAIEKARVVTTIRTATDWVREWRRGDFLPPQKR
jgi:hypothetical protein